MEIALFVILAIILLVFVAGIYIFVVACIRGKDVSWLDSESLKGTVYERFDDLIHASHDWIMAHDCQDVYTNSEDGLKLHALWIPAKDPKGTILFAHGYRSSIMIDFGKALNVYHKMGFNMLLPTQRSHGKSEGKIITFGIKESRDMLCWIDFHNKTFGDHQMILSGMSMGAATMMYLADKELPENVKGFIVDCGFTSPAEIISEVYKRTTHLPAIPVIWAADIVARVVGGFSLYERNSKKVLKKITLPILMIHGKADKFVPHEMTLKGYENCVGDKQLFLVEGAGHGLSFILAEEEYKERITAFLKKNIEGL